MAHPPIEYHLRIETPDGAHGDYASDTPFPAISVGDIVAYESKYKDGVIAHRVVEIGSDSSGWYARIKGDNNDYVDPGKVRFEQIKRIVVAVIY